MPSGQRYARSRLIDILCRRWWLILLPVVIGTLAGAARSTLWYPDAQPRIPLPSVPDPVLENHRFGVMAAWVAGGLAFGFVLAALVEQRDSTFKCEEDVHRVLSMPVLAAVPLMDSEENQAVHRRNRLVAAVTGFLVVIIAAALILWSLYS